MTDYSTLLDADVMAFISKTKSYYSDALSETSIQGQRETYNRMCLGFAADRPIGVKAEDSFIETASHKIPIRIYNNSINSKAKVIYFHGGGFVLGDLNSHDDVCAEICAETGFEVISVDYRLSPEHPFPADFEDAKAAFEYLSLLTAQPIVLVGDSAGASLAASVSHACRTTDKSPAGQVLIYPTLGGDQDQKSFVEHANAPLLTTKDMAYYQGFRTGGDEKLLEDPRCSPLKSLSFSDLPPTYIVSAQCDPLASDSESYFKAIKLAGGDVKWVNEPGLVHGYLRARHNTEKGAASFARILAAIKRLGEAGKLP